MSLTSLENQEQKKVERGTREENPLKSTSKGSNIEELDVVEENPPIFNKLKKYIDSNVNTQDNSLSFLQKNLISSSYYRDHPKKTFTYQNNSSPTNIHNNTLANIKKSTIKTFTSECNSQTRHQNQQCHTINREMDQNQGNKQGTVSLGPKIDALSSKKYESAMVIDLTPKNGKSISIPSFVNVEDNLRQNSASFSPHLTPDMQAIRNKHPHVKKGWFMFDIQNSFERKQAESSQSDPSFQEEIAQILSSRHQKKQQEDCKSNQYENLPFFPNLCQEKSLFNRKPTKAHFGVWCRGAEVVKELENADVFYFNELRKFLGQHQYTAEKRDQFLKKTVKQIKNKSKNYGRICSICFISMGKLEKKWCSFCLDYVCSDCLSPRQHPIPSEFQLRFDLSLHPVCKVAEQFLLENNYMLISPQNPLVSQQPVLFEILKIRRKAHKLFNLVKCEERSELLEQIGYLKDNKHLLVKDCYLRLCQIPEIKNGFIQYLLEQIARVFQNHIDSCEVCFTPGEPCLVCLEYVQRYDIENVTCCKKCLRYGHFDCMSDHDCL